MIAKMREWLKVLLGVTALTIGASAPSLLLESYRPGTLWSLGPARGIRKPHNLLEETNTPADRNTTYFGKRLQAPTLDEAGQSDSAVRAELKGQPRWYADPNWWVAGFTGCLSLVTGLLWIFTWLLWNSTRRAVAGEENALRIAATNAAAVEMQAKAAVHSERPFVHYSKMDLVTLKKPRASTDRIYRLDVEFKNYGRTPAFITEIKTGHTIAQRLPERPQYFGLGFAEFLMGTNDTHTHRSITIIGIDEPEWRSIQTHNSLLFCWGKIKYRDFMGGVTDIGFCAACDFGHRTTDGMVVIEQPRFFNPADPSLAVYTYEQYSPTGKEA